MVKAYLFLAILVIALVAVTSSLLGSGGFERRSALEASVAAQRARNRALSNEVNLLKREVYGLQQVPRELEKAARNNLGMARPDEFIFIFDERIAQTERPDGQTEGPDRATHDDDSSMRASAPSENLSVEGAR